MLPPLFPLAFEFFLRHLCRDMAMAIWRKRVLVAAREPGPMHAGTRQVLLLFKKRASRAIQSPHDGDGELHVAFAIPSSELANWESWLQTRGIAVEEKRTWELGGWSLYFRDPDRQVDRTRHAGTWSVY